METLILKSKRERAVLLRHPWIFSGAVAQLPAAEEGEIIQVKSSKNELLGYGFYSKKSQITCRMFEWGSEEKAVLHREYWGQKINGAAALRRQLIKGNETNAFRLIHAEGDFIPGLIVDVYGQVAVMQILIKGIEKLKDLIVEAIVNEGFPHVYLKAITSSHVLEDVQTASVWLAGGVKAPVMVMENKIKFMVDFITGQKTGFFLDQRENRYLLHRLSLGKKVLNTFSYTGGFSVYALAGGAKQVHSVDISADAIETGNENVAMNFPVSPHESFVADCFEFLKEMPSDEYDIIVLDPPAFAKHSRAVAKASGGYKQINLQAFRKIKKGGLVFTFSCSRNIPPELFRKIIFGAAIDSGRKVRILHQLHQPFDHPVNICHPEGEYLKGLVLQVE